MILENKNINNERILVKPKTRSVPTETEDNTDTKALLVEICNAIRDGGFNPVSQIVGYIISEDPTHITNYNNARMLIGKIDRDELQVVKRDGSRQPFDRQKLDKAIRQACGKRPVSDEQIRTMIDHVVSKLEGDEVKASTIAELVMAELHKADEVAYIRFASVYRQFTDVAQFLSAITEIVKK